MEYSPDSFDLTQAMQSAFAAHQRGDLQTAEQQYRAVLRKEPKNADALHFLGLLEHQKGNTQAATPLLDEACRLQPANALYQHNRAGLYLAAERYLEAERYYRQALSLNPNNVDSYVGLASVEIAEENYTAALRACNTALKLDTTNFAAVEKKGRALSGLGRDREAIELYRQLICLAQQDSRKLYLAGKALQAAAATDDAIMCYRKAIECGAASWEIHNDLGLTLADTGDFDGAEACFRHALALKPDSASTLYNLVSTTRLSLNDPLRKTFADLSTHLERLAPEEAIALQFALGTLQEQAGNYEQAFHHLVAGNRQKRTRISYEEDQQKRFCRDCIRYFDNNFTSKNVHSQSTPAPALTPIFIVGMPRSGTTLVEQIFASHPQVYGGGESLQLWRSVRTELALSSKDDNDVPSRLAAASPAVLGNISARYAAGLQPQGPGIKFVTDKLSGNAAFIGLIRVAFPTSRIIYCRRDPLDTCISCFSKLFTQGNPFSYNLGELGHFYKLYEALMQHWTGILPAGSILAVRYEDIVANLEAEIRRILAFCGLGWDESCLRFYNTRRTVHSASRQQVRQPIFSSAIGRWKHYSQHLEPLREALSWRADADAS